MSDEDPERVQEHSVERKNDRAERVENILDETDALTRDRKFPVTSEELATEYAGQERDLSNETESLGSVFDRLEDRREFDSAEEVREAVYGELTGDAGGRTESNVEYNEERELQEIAEQVEDNESNVNDQ